ncbi:MAG: ribonuclease G [Coriobacteriaceae bacterium]|nr:ribonuclease G [Coriobacteriaceae bacterium]
MGGLSVVPPEARGWNWGAFFLSWIWGIGNNTWIALLALIPYVNFVMVFVLGAKGSEWAWRNKRWESVEQFRRTQRTWAIVGLVLFAIGVILGIIGAVAASMNPSTTTTGMTI